MSRIAFGLHLVELEGGHQLPGGVGARLGLADDAMARSRSS